MPIKWVLPIHISRTLLAGLLVLTYVTLATAQDTQERDIVTEAANRALTGRSNAQPTLQVKSKYNRFDDQTAVQLENMQVTGGKFDGIHLSAAYYCPGDVLFCKPDKVFIGVVVVIKGSRYDLPSNLVVLADGERSSFALQNFGSTNIMPEWNIIATTLGVVVSYDTFVKIAKSRKIEMRLDQAEFELQAWQRSAFSDFAILMYPKARIHPASAH